MANHQFLAGAAKVDITPPLGTFINGDFVAHTAKYIHDPLYARALVFQHGDTFVAVVVVDICVMPKDFVDAVKTEILQQTGIAPSNILISATHTHAAGSVDAVYLGVADDAYKQNLPPLIVQSVVLAKQQLKPAKIAWGSINAPEHVLCRRYRMKSGYLPQNPVTGVADIVKTNPFGAEHFIVGPVAETDPQLGFLAIKDIADNWISLLANYSLHYVGDWENGTITADYFGEFAKQLQAKLHAGENFVGMMSNGTSGDVNIWDFSNPNRYPTPYFEKSKLIGGDIAEMLCQELVNLNWDESPSLAVNYQELNIELRKPSAEELQDAKQLVENTNYHQLAISDETLKPLYAREQVLLSNEPDNLHFPIQTIEIGEGIIGGLGAEMFAETGLWLKHQSPVKNYFTICLANGNAGYVPPAHEFNNGGYETWRSRTSKLRIDAEGIIREKLLSQIKSLASLC